jgi:hypothetical protein
MISNPGQPVMELVTKLQAEVNFQKTLKEYYMGEVYKSRWISFMLGGLVGIGSTCLVALLFG